MSISKKKRGNDLVNISDFRNRVEKITGYKEQHIVEEEADLPFNSLSKIYSGQQALTVDHLLRIANAYGCSIDYLLGNDTSKGSREKDVNAAEFIDMVHKLQNIGAIKIQPKTYWKATVNPNGYDEQITVSSSAILISNSNLESIMQEYIKLKQAMLIVENFPESVYDSWLNGKRESNAPINGETLPFHVWQEEDERRY